MAITELLLTLPFLLILSYLGFRPFARHSMCLPTLLALSQQTSQAFVCLSWTSTVVG
jgi:hypothetical protein